MKKTYYIVVCVAALLFSCTDRKEAGGQVASFHVDLKNEASPEVMESFLNNMQIRLMPLETTDSCLFSGGASHLNIVDDYLFVVDGEQRCFFRFDKSGKYINKIGNRGEGDKEYTALLSNAIANKNIYVKDWTKIQVYDYDNNYIRSIPYKGSRCQIHVSPEGRIYARRSYANDTQLQVLDQEGKVIAEYFPTEEVVRGFKIPKGNARCMGNYDKGIYITNPMDNAIYLLQDTVRVIARLDFGALNLPSDFFSGTSEQVEAKFWDLRGGITETKAILFINNLIVTDDWITFCPETFDPVIVFCNRKTNTCITNRGFEAPYSVFFDKYKSPDGYNASTGEFYRLLDAMELKKMIETLAEEDKDYSQIYPFLKGIDPEKIDEDSNDWVLFFKMN